MTFKNFSPVYAVEVGRFFIFFFMLLIGSRVYFCGWDTFLVDLDGIHHQLRPHSAVNIRRQPGDRAVINISR